MVFVLSEWLIILSAFAFSLLEYLLFQRMLNSFESLNIESPSPLLAPSAALICSLRITVVSFAGAVWIASKADYLFADFAIVLSGILFSGALCFIYPFRQILAVLMSRETHQAEFVKH